MKVAKKLQKPENWQDFESLCKKLWGEIWKCEEIKKNGRQGQNQSGVDIYGIPKNEKEYYGIQCKGKDDYTDAKLTEKEIDAEIEKAKKFKPKLKKYYFVTTGNKDVQIEEYIRERNLENINKGLFEIHLFCWEDIVDLINENSNTYRYYIESINFKDENDIELLFDNGKNIIDINVFFSQKTKKYIYKESLKLQYGNIPDMSFLLKEMQFAHPFLGEENKGDNMSWGSIELILNNKGNKQLENYKVYLNFSGNIQYLDEKSGIWYLMIKPENRDTFLFNESKQGTLKPRNNKPLVPKDSYNFDHIDFKPTMNGGKIYIDWELVSSHYNTSGRLEINVTSKIIEEEETIDVNSIDEVREEKNIEDFYYKEEKEKK